MGQQKFNGFDVVNEHLFEDAHAFLLNRPQGLCLQLFLKGDADVFQGVVSRLMGQGQPPDIEQGIEDSADGDSSHPANSPGRFQSAIAQQRQDQLVGKPEGQDAHGHAQQEDGHRLIRQPAVFPRIIQYFLEHKMTSFD